MEILFIFLLKKKIAVGCRLPAAGIAQKIKTNYMNFIQQKYSRFNFGGGGVNPSISDSPTYTLSAKTMFDTFEGNAEGCYLFETFVAE